MAPCVGIDADDVEAHGLIDELCIPCQKHSRSANELALFTLVDGQPGCHERLAASKPYFNDNKTSAVLHDQVELAETASKITPDGNQALSLQEVKSEIFSVAAYSSCVASNHDSSSAASGNSISGSLLMS